MEFSKNFVCECLEYSTYEKSVATPLFRKSFVLKSKPKAARILICGLGFYDLFINGKTITKGKLAPYISNSDHICYYDSYDICENLNIGENVIGVMLGDGFQVGKTSVWDIKDNITNCPPLLALTAEIIDDNEKVLFDAGDFVCKKGPIVFNDLRSGVFYDARLEESGWNRSGFVEKGWHKPISGIYKPRGYAKLCYAEPIKIMRKIKPKSIRRGELAPYSLHAIEDFAKSITPFESAVAPTGGYIYDFGENNTGIFRLKIKGKRGQKVDIQCGEQLVDGKLSYANIWFYPDGFSQRDIYYLKGDDEEEFEPMFTYHGFRYIYVSGITEEQATGDLLTFLVMSSDLEERGSFECSDKTANLIYEMGRRSDISNFIYFPNDCPHREKNGWTGDASVSAEHMIMTISPEKSWREWMNNIRMAQRENGEIPGIVPTDSWGYDWGNGPAWDSVLFNLPYFVYKYRGETEMIKENATAMFRYLEYISRRRDKKGIIAVGLGDWLPVVRNDGGRKSDASLGFTDSVMVIDMCRKAAKMFDEIGLASHKEFAERLENELLEAVRSEYIDFATYIVDGGYQSTQAMAIFYDIFTENEKPRAFDVLLDIIHEDNDSFTCGFLGIRVLFHVLSEFGESELAYKMITKPDFPSYGYWVEKGETTMLENFEEYGEYYSKSKNHHFLADVENWFMSCLGGINVKNSNEVIIKPRFIRQLEWCRATHKLPNGEVKVSWVRTDNGIELKADVAAGIKYSIEIDEKSDETILIK